MFHEIANSVQFFLPQLFLGVVLGALIASMGVIIVLRKMSFFGVTLSQVVSTCVGITLFLGIKNEFFPILLSIAVLIPLFIFYRNVSSEDTILGILFVSFTAFSQVLLSFGGNVQQHLLSAYFGDILTSETNANPKLFLLVGVCIAIFTVFYKRILFLSFDEDEFKVRGFSVFFTEIVFFFIVTAIISVSVNLLGTFYSLAQMLMPVYSGIFFSRSMKTLFVFSIAFSIVGTIIGFIFSLFPITAMGTEIHLPTSSTIVVAMSVMTFLSVLFSKR